MHHMPFQGILFTYILMLSAPLLMHPKQLHCQELRMDTQPWMCAEPQRSEGGK